MRSIESFYTSKLFETVAPFVDDNWTRTEELLTALAPFLNRESWLIVRDSPANAFKAEKPESGNP